MKTTLPLFFFFLINTLVAQTANPLLIKDGEKIYRLDSVAQVFVDSVGGLTDEEVRGTAFQGRFHPVREKSLRGKPGWTVWLKIPILNQSESDEWQFVLRADDHEKNRYRHEYLAEQAYVDVFSEGENGLLEHQRTGVMVPASEKNFAATPLLNAVLLTLPRDSVVLFVKIGYRNHLFFHLSSELRPENMTIPVDFSSTVGSISFNRGMGFILSLLSFFFFLFVRDRAYLFFCFYAGLIAAHYLILSPDLPFITDVVPEHPIISEYAWLFCTRASYVFFALFGRAFVNLRVYSKWMDNALLTLAGLMFLEMIMAMTIYPPEIRRTPQPQLAAIMFSLMLIGIRIFFLPSKLAKVFGAGAFVLMFSTVLGILWETTSLELSFNPWTTGQILMMVIYTLGLAMKLQMNEQAKSEAQRVLELDAVKSRFFANISHEFRTPLTLILGPLKKAQEQMPASELDQTSEVSKTSEVSLPVRHVGMMRRNAERLGQLIDQLLDLSKLENGSMKLRVVEGDVVKFVRAMVFSFESLAERRQIHFQTEFPPVGEMAFFDKDKLEKIIVNLLSNAFKYTPEKGRVSVKTILAEGRLKVSVEDSGPGISKTDLDKIFERFYQVDPDSYRGEDKGTGIGLSLVKELVELHRGQISVESAEGKGTVFKVSLPVAREAFGESAVLSPQSTVHSTHNSTFNPLILEEEVERNGLKTDGLRTADNPLLLIVEDNPDLRHFIAETMSGAYQILTAENGKIGFETAIEKTPDLIVSDVMMPEMDGFEMCETLKKDERTSHIPIILLTAKAGQKHKVEGLETGADDYLTKPFDENELLVRAKNLVEQRRKLRECFAGVRHLSPTEVAVTSADERFLKKVTTAIEENMDNEFFSVEDLASAVAFSRSQLHRKLKALVGKSPNELIREFRLARAKELLEKGHGNVSEVAMEVGYSSLSYFTRSFKAAFGVSPSEV